MSFSESNSNEKDLFKQQYLQNMLTAFERFEYTRSPEVLKAYIKKNREALSIHIEEINQINLLSTKGQNINIAEFESIAYKREKELNDKLEKQFAEELEISKGNNLRESQARFDDKTNSMETTIFKLKSELTRLATENKTMENKLAKERFYKEWEVMNKEFIGAKNLGAKLKAELEKKKNEISTLANQ